jgi:hypothetical protein
MSQKTSYLRHLSSSHSYNHTVNIGNVNYYTCSNENERLIIDADNIVINCSSNTYYVIVPRPEGHITISHFSDDDIIDLSEFAELTEYTDLTITQDSGAMSLSLPESQLVTITDFNASDINEDNFVFAPLDSLNEYSLAILLTIVGLGVLTLSIPAIAHCIDYCTTCIYGDTQHHDNHH